MFCEFCKSLEKENIFFRILKEALTGLSVFLSKNVIPEDLYSDNVLFSKNLNCKLIDLGDYSDWHKLLSNKPTEEKLEQYKKNIFEQIEIVFSIAKNSLNIADDICENLKRQAHIILEKAKKDLLLEREKFPEKLVPYLKEIINQLSVN